jgi:hypothetical protein
MKPLKVCGCCVDLQRGDSGDDPSPVTTFTLGVGFVGVALRDDTEEMPEQTGAMLVPLHPYSATYEELVESGYADEPDFVKFKVADGKYAGFVGYAIIRERAAHGLAR